MSRTFGSLLLAATACLTSPLLAEEPAAEPTKQAPQEVPKDPDGVQGISPFWEAVNRGDAAFLAQDLGAATNHYQTAITGDPKNPIGHLRMAEVTLRQGEIDSAQGFITAALRFAGDDLRIKAAASFLLAELRERQAGHDDAIDTWNRYKAIDSQLPKDQAQPTSKGPLPAHVYTETSDARIKAIEAKKKLDSDYAAVRQRIKENIEKADASTGAAAGTPAGE